MQDSQNTNRLDVTGLHGPDPVMETRRRLRSVAPGDVLEIWANDPSTVHDIPAYCRTAGHHLVMAEERGDLIIFQVRKGEKM